MEKQRNLFLYFKGCHYKVYYCHVDQLNSASTTIESLRTLMNETASKLLEYPVVMAMKGLNFTWSSVDS